MKKLIYTALSFSPVLALAQSGVGTVGNLTSLTTSIGTLLGRFIPLLFALALIYFFWGLVKYIQAAGDPKAAAEGKSIMIYGIIAIAVMVSIYGLVAWLQSTLGVQGGSVTLPTVPGL